MTVNYTTNLSLGLPVTGTESGTWGDDVNNALTAYLDIAIAGGLAITVTTADVTLTLTQGTSAATNIGSTTAQYAILNVSGAMTAARNLIVPSSSRQYVINNNTTGGFLLTVKGTATTGVTLVNGEKAHVFWNGSDYAKLSNAQGGAGSFTTLSATGVATFSAGTAALPAITTTGDTNTGIWFPAADTIAFTEGGAESMRIDSSGNVGIGTTSPTAKLNVSTGVAGNLAIFTDGINTDFHIKTSSLLTTIGPNAGSTSLAFQTGGTERARIDTSGNLLVGKTSTSFSDVGVLLSKTGNEFTVNGAKVMAVNRGTDDGVLIEFFQAGTSEGNISVSGTTVSYNGGHLSRWAQTIAPKDNSLVKGTVLSNLDEMNVYTDADGNPVENEQLNKVKVSDVDGDANVAGVFVNWTHDDAHDVDEINMAMTGDMIIRIAQGVTVQRGDLLMSAGDGTAKPQGDDIVRSKTVAKVTSIHVTCTYADGSFCVPCVLMAC